MQKIRISVKSLREKLLQLENDHMELAELRFVPCQIDSGSNHPAFLHLDGITTGGDYRDYESIDEASLIEFLMPRIPS